ncbi:hypothetical protein ABFT23_06460 [Nocardioides sp. C4-1]|uniref:hypothetical protein n=1 Tax=Nocardioides sp. C4-1 TaxID=3151851 RepID=UPI003265B793
MNRRARRGTVAAVLPVLALVSLLTACGGDDGGGSTEPITIEVTVDGGTVTPSGDRVEVDVDQPVDIVVTADEPGELHVHSSPETTREFTAGENAPIGLRFDRPGIVEVELHEPFEGPVVELEIS